MFRQWYLFRSYWQIYHCLLENSVHCILLFMLHTCVIEFISINLENLFICTCICLQPLWGRIIMQLTNCLPWTVSSNAKRYHFVNRQNIFLCCHMFFNNIWWVLRASIENKHNIINLWLFNTKWHHFLVSCSKPSRKNGYLSVSTGALLIPVKLYNFCFVFFG